MNDQKALSNFTRNLKQVSKNVLWQLRLFFSKGIHASVISEHVEIRPQCIVRNSFIEKYAQIYEGVVIKKSTIAPHCSINANCYIENAIIGEKTQVAPGCIIVGVTHDHSQKEISHIDIFEKITIGKNCWVCANCTILPGVTIGDNCIIAAGAILNKDVPTGHIYKGMPSRNNYPIPRKLNHV